MHKIRTLRSSELVTKHLDDDYETKQLVPVWGKIRGKDPDPSQEKIEKLTDDVPESVHIKMRLATFEAIADDIVADTIAERPDVAEDEIVEELEPVIKTAVDHSEVPEQLARNIVKDIIAKHYRVKDPMMALLEKTANHIANKFVRMEEGTTEDIQVDKVLDTDPADVGADIVNDTVEHTGDNIQTTDTAVPTVVEAIIRNQAVSKVNNRISTMLAMRFFAGPQLRRMLYTLRHHLPERFKKKYNIDY